VISVIETIEFAGKNIQSLGNMNWFHAISLMDTGVDKAVCGRLAEGGTLR
jgi:hypothetical protein